MGAVIFFYRSSVSNCCNFERGVYIVLLQKRKTMAKVEFEDPIASLTGILVGSDPYYFRRYPKSGGGVMHIAQARPNRSGHTPSPEELAARIRFGQVFGREKHQAHIERIYKNQLTINFIEDE